MNGTRDCTVATALGFVLLARVAFPSAAEDFVVAGLEACAKTKAIQAEMRTLGRAETSRMHVLQGQARSLAKPAPGPEVVEKLAAEIAMCKQRIADLERAIELAKLKDPSARVRRATELQAEAKGLREQASKQKRPYFDKMRQVKQELAATTEYRAKALKPYFLNPTEKHPTIAAMKVRASRISGSVSCCWRAASNAIIAEANVEVEPPPERKPRKLLANTYPLGYLNDQHLNVTAGYFRVHFHAGDKTLEGRDRIAEVVQDFINLKGLAAIKPAAP